MSARRLQCSVVAAALVSLATFSTAAHAQPACAVGVLSDYLALTGGCTIGGVTFTDFQATFGAFNTPAQLSHVDVTPFSVGDQIGFSRALNQPLSVLANGAPGLVFAERFFEFDFATSGLGAGGLIGVSPFSLFTSSVVAPAGGPVTGDVATAQLTVRSAVTGDSVLIATEQFDGHAQTSGCAVADQLLHSVPCTPLVTMAFAGGPVALVGTVDAWGGVNAPASASLANLAVTIVVPPAPVMVTAEPESAVLLGSGVGALGIVGARRRRRQVARPDETA